MAEHLFGVRVALELDDRAHSRAVGLVADVRDGRENPLLLLGELEDLLQQRALVDLVGQLRHDQVLLAAGQVLDVDLGAQQQAAAAGLVGLADLLGRKELAAGGEVRRGQDLHQRVQGDVRVVQDRDDRVDGFAQVVCGDVRGQAHRDAGGAVDEQVGEAPGEHVRLLERVVKVQGEGDGVLFQVAQQLHGKGRHARLGVSHGRGGVAVHGAEVAVAVHQRRAHVEVLRHAHHRVVDGDVAVGVVFAQAVAHDAGALAVGLVGRVAQFQHGVEDAPLHGLEAVLDPGQGALEDDVLRVGDHAVVHDLLHGFLQDRLVALDGLVASLLRHQPFTHPSKESTLLKFACWLM